MDRKNISLLTSIAVVTLLILVVGASYAYFSVKEATTTSGTTLTATSPALTSISLSQGESTLSIYLSALQMSEEKGGTTYWAQAGSEKEATVERQDVEIATAQITNGGEGKYYRCDANFTITPNDPDNAISGLGKDNVKLYLAGMDLNKIVTIEDGRVKKVSSPVYFKGPLDTVSITASLRINNSKEDQSSAINKNFTIQIDLELNNCGISEEPQPSLSEAVKNKYKSDTTLLGSTEANNDGYLIYHDGKDEYAQYEAGDYSYRFSGNNPDNWVCMDGENKEGKCDSKKLYRVIGIFPVNPSKLETSAYQVKLIKSEYLTYEETESELNINSRPAIIQPDGWIPRVENQSSVNGFYWSGSESITWNNWKSSTLNVGLNKEDGVYLQSLQPYIDAGLISDTTWYIGGNDDEKISQSINMKLAYDNELGKNKLTPGKNIKKCTGDSEKFTDCTDNLLYQTSKIGLMYATEYGYAASPSRWNTQLLNYDISDTQKNNWLYNGVYEWFLTRETNEELGRTTVYIVYPAGWVRGNRYVVYADTSGVRPTFFLESDAKLLNGDGSKEKPWRIKLS